MNLIILVLMLMGAFTSFAGEVTGHGPTVVKAEIKLVIKNNQVLILKEIASTDFRQAKDVSGRYVLKRK